MIMFSMKVGDDGNKECGMWFGMLDLIIELSISLRYNSLLKSG